MTWFQLVDSRLGDSEPSAPLRGNTRLAPNSALFLNPALPLRSAPRPVKTRTHLRLVKGSRVGSAAIPSAA